MSETTTTEETPATGRRGRRGRNAEAGSVDPAEPVDGAGPVEGTATPRRTTKASDIEKINTEQIEAAELGVNISTLLVRATAPQRVRSEQQIAMDTVAQRAYNAWVARGRPAAWGKLPSVTYFLDPDEVDHWKYLIRRATELIDPAPFKDKDGNDVVAPGVRWRFGTAVTLTPELADKIGRPEDAGKTILAWAAVDKRGFAAEPEAEAEDEDDEDLEEADADAEADAENGDASEGTSASEM
jgi:hypothetical protein